jgi:DNA segregation ATPase FtsK/SpoIIIE, S-DNA-T family
MKPIRIVLSPTRSRPVNIFLGMVLVLVSLLLFLALASYHPTDPSLNTSTDFATPHNWTGIFGAWIADMLLQTFGLTSFLLPLWLGGVGWTWMHSRPGGSPILRWMGTLLAVVFLPCVFGLLPWHWRWLHAVAVEGVVGRLVSGLLVVYLNTQGAWVVAAALAATGLYFASAISFSTIREILADRWITLTAWRDRWRNRREEKAELRAEQEAQAQHEEIGQQRQKPIAFPQLVPEPAASFDEEPPARGFARLFAFFRRRPVPHRDVLVEIPAYQREPLQPSLPLKDAPVPITQRKSSIWERAGSAPASEAAPAVAASVAAPPVLPVAAPTQSARREAVGSRAVEQWLTASSGSSPATPPEPAARSNGEIAIHGRADAEMRPVTVARSTCAARLFRLTPAPWSRPSSSSQKPASNTHALPAWPTISASPCGQKAF